MNIEKTEKGQALAPFTKKMDVDSFEDINGIHIYWLGGAGAMINSFGTIIMIDPVLCDFDMPLLRPAPIDPIDVKKLNAILVTHIDKDHYSIKTCKELMSVCKEYHSTFYVSEEMKKEGILGIGHGIKESFYVNDVKITLIPVKHNWQNEMEEYNYRQWNEDEYCGYFIKTHGKSIWIPSDSKLIEEHLHMPNPDVILFDFSDDSWHISLDGAITLANTYPNSDLICIHYGCIDAPTMPAFNANPEVLFSKIKNPERIKVLAPGERFCLHL